jgi:hypothetical protein
MTDDEIRAILKNNRTVASVGLSADETKDSFGVVVYLKRAGFRVIPINPHADKILGEKAYKDLLSIPRREVVDIVQIFRPASEVPTIVAQAIQINAKVIWMQENIENADAAEQAVAAGLQVVMNLCMMKEHRRLLARLPTD